ncbi:MAG: LamG domain-containing protein [Phycisphaerae bacterium]|nr:LamG domain-containing protein [Phycisphaerae bacterium]
MAANMPYIPGIIDQALAFDGEDDYIETSGFRGIPGNSSRTCSAWINSDSKNNMSFISWGTNIPGQQWLFGAFGSGQLSLYSEGKYINSTKGVLDNQWHHVAVVLADDGSPSIDEIKLYIDGQLQTDTLANSDQAINTIASKNLIIGAYYSTPDVISGYFDGLIDDVRIYTTALDSYAIADLYFQGRPGSEICLLEENDLHYDYNDDCRVDLTDVAVLSSLWLASTDINDLSGLAQEWLTKDLYSVPVIETVYDDDMSSLTGWTEVSNCGPAEIGDDAGGIRVVDNAEVGQVVKMYSWWRANDIQTNQMNIWKNTGVIIEADTKYAITLKVSLDSSNANHRMVLDIQYVDSSGIWTTITAPEIVNIASGTLGFQEYTYSFDNAAVDAIGNPIGIGINAGWNNCQIDNISIVRIK